MAEGVLILGLLVVVALAAFAWSKRSKSLDSPDTSGHLAMSSDESHPLPPQHESRSIDQDPPPEVATVTLTEKKIFLSYRREDSADVAGRIYDRLTQVFEKAQVFKDVDSIPLGVDFRKHLQETVSSCDVVLVVMGDDWLTAATADGSRRIDNPKDFVRIEVETALQRDIPVIPVLVRGAGIPDERDLPGDLSALAYRNGIAVRSDPDFHRDMDRLVKSLEAYLAGSPLGT